MNRLMYRLSVLMVALGIGGAMTVRGQAPGSINAANGVAIQGYDAVAYVTDQRAVKGQRAFSHQWRGVTWHFASAANRDRFAITPEAFAPQFGGYCAYGVSRGYAVDIDPQAFTIDDGKLYLNYSKRVQATWNQDRAGYIENGAAELAEGLGGFGEKEVVMTTLVSAHAAPRDRAVLKAVLWLMRLTVAGILLQTLFFKFTGAAESVFIFETLGAEPYGRIGSGVAELIAAALILTPSTVAIGALLALGVISGAIVSHLTVLGIEVMGDGGLLFALAVVVLVCSAAVLVAFADALPIVGPKLRAQSCAVPRR